MEQGIRIYRHKHYNVNRTAKFAWNWNYTVTCPGKQDSGCFTLDEAKTVAKIWQRETGYIISLDWK